jgi:hypothetical protein
MQNVSASGVRSGARGHPGTGDDLVSGWQRKHDAIAAAALVLFARDGVLASTSSSVISNMR